MPGETFCKKLPPGMASTIPEVLQPLLDLFTKVCFNHLLV